MAYTDDAVLAKLSALNETQESIVTVAQWVMFHRRHADRTGQLWLQRLKDSGSNKRLNLIYLANEVAQQSKARRKDDFLIAFSPVIAEATATAYKGATNDVQQKLRRVVEVWRQRAIFEVAIQDAIEARIDEIDKSKSTKKGGSLLGGSIFSSGTSSSIPAELTPLVAPQQSVSKLVLSTKTSMNAANAEYEKHTDPAAPVPSAPVHAARLNGLLKTLANAEGAVAESIKARTQLIEGLEKLLTTNRAALLEEQKQLEEIATRRSGIDAKKREVEDNIMRGFASNSNPSTPAGVGNGGDAQTPGTPAEPDRPEVEALTPPAYEAFTPEPEDNGFGSPGPIRAREPDYSQQPATEPPTVPIPAGADLLSSLSTTYPIPISGTEANSAKRRKLNDGEFPGFGGDGDLGLDADVEEMLRKDNGELA